MDLKAFLQLYCQLADSCKATIKIQGYELVIETGKSSWTITTKICSKGQVPLSFLNSLALSRFSIFEKQGVFLKRNSQDGKLYLMKKTTALQTFDDFERVINSFIKICDQWKSLLDDLDHLNSSNLIQK